MDLFAWPASVVSLLAKQKQEKQRLQNAFKRGIALRTHYSGVETPSLILQWLGEACVSQGLWSGRSCRHGAGVLLLHSVDTSPNAQQFMRACNTRCLFTDILDRLPAEVPHIVVRELSVVALRVETSCDTNLSF